MEIVQINETKRGRFALFSQDGFLFSIDGETLSKFDLREGALLSEGALSSLKESSDTRKAKDQALRYLSLRAYAEKELYDKLCVKYDAPTCAAAVAAMVELELLDDEKYAVEKAKGMVQRGKSRMEIQSKLMVMGIDRVMIGRALQEADVQDDASALALVYKMYVEKLRRGEHQKVMAALARRGFAHSAVRNAVETVEQELQAETEMEFE